MLDTLFFSQVFLSISYGLIHGYFINLRENNYYKYYCVTKAKFELLWQLTK